MANIAYYLHVYYSKRDQAGNCYWAFTMVDTKAGREVSGTISGGESNIDSIRYDWDGKGNGWEGGCSVLRIASVEMGEREFNHMTKDWPYAGCTREDLQAFIRKGFGL